MREKGKKYIKYLHKKGFTLAELLIVVAIIAVLVAVSIPIFTGRLEKARLAANEANIRSAKAAAIADWMDTARENGEEIDETLLAKLMEMLNTEIVVYATHGGGDNGSEPEPGSGDATPDPVISDRTGGSGGQGNGSGFSGSGKLFYDDGAGKRTYGYQTSTNGLYNPGTDNPSITETGVYTEIFVKIDTENADITTCPHIEGGKALPSFGSNDFDQTSGTDQGTSGGNTGGVHGVH